MKGAIRKNLLTERIDIVKSLGWYRDSPTLTDVDVKYLLLYFEENYGLTVEKKIIDAVAVIANENRYHPVCDFLNALQWDGTERIRFCLHRFLGSDNSTLPTQNNHSEKNKPDGVFVIKQGKTNYKVKPFTCTSKQLFLLTYRTMAWHYHKKQEQINATCIHYEKLREEGYDLAKSNDFLDYLLVDYIYICGVL